MIQNSLKTFTATAILLALATPTALAFPDVPDTHENYLAIEFLNENGVVSGYPDGTYKPAQLVNRVEALKIILEGNSTTISKDFAEIPFSDVSLTDWFTQYVMTAKELGIVEGNPDGTFAPARTVIRAEFLKMLLNTNGFKSDKWEGAQIFADVPADEWYTPYMNYSGQAGLVSNDENNNLYPAQELDRGQVAEIIYVLSIILKGNDTEFLTAEAQKQMEQVETYIDNDNPSDAKRSSELAVDMTQQAYKNLPEDTAILGMAKIARSYDFLVKAHMFSLDQNWGEVENWAHQSVDKADEAWQTDSNLEPTANKVKSRAEALLTAIPN